MASFILGLFMLLSGSPIREETQLVSSDELIIQVGTTESARITIAAHPGERLSKGKKKSTGIFETIAALPRERLGKGKGKPTDSFETPDGFARGFRAASLQWSTIDPRPWCILEGYDFSDPAHPPRQRIIARMIQALKKDVAEFLGRPRPQWVQITRKLRMEDRSYGALAVFVLCEACGGKEAARAIGENSQQLMASTDKFEAELRQLDELYWNLRTTINVRPILMLQIFHANLNLFADFLERFAVNYANPRLNMVDPQQVELRHWSLKAIVADSQLYRQLTNVGKEMTNTVESLLEVVLALKSNATLEVPEDKTQLAALGAEIKGCTKEISTRLAQISDDLDHGVQLLDLSRDLSQSGNVKTLTLLATIFLPLSLSAGVLSMQSRFKDLGDLLYDFFGVVVLLTAVVLLLIGIMFVLSSVKEFESRLWRYPLYRRFGRRALLAMTTVIALVFGALLLTSFLVGMFKDVALGAKILGYGVVVAVGGPVVIAFIVWLVTWVYDLVGTIFDTPIWRMFWRREKRDNLEEGEGPPESTEKKTAAVGDTEK